VAEELLRAEGFTDIRYVDVSGSGSSEFLARGEVDFELNVGWSSLPAIDAGAPITVLAGVMVGCYELFAKQGIRSVAELKGKSVGAQAAGPSRLGLPTLLVAYVGLDPAKDIDWVTALPSNRSSASLRAGSMRFSRRSPRNCAPAVSAM
jgi:NitT/TauT family transport system substrate-binding protein